ncbi:PQQ-dependent sugar dehydrogenase [Methanobacterium alcaliphilum]|uniref:PQQ-dependent sugar dehydrogenase n=1 Tax=Methanobacterium alcaliphilum TaxID=392018 RepID=UPI00200B1223|nr:PQQ-dependent sugar dehydrogenase [Methanobacterium alcaliphilum]
MNKKLVLFLIIIIAVAAAVLYLIWPQPVNEEGFQSQVVVTGLNSPWAIDFLPNGTMIFTERGGEVSVWEGNSVHSVGNISVKAEGESGLLGIAVDPEFDKNNYIYLYYTAQNSNRISRFVLNQKLENETILLDDIPSSVVHDGGRLKFGPDGKLYATTGDASQKPLSQDINSLAGKILRLNKDGSVPADNPFNNYVWSYGHRNPQGITWNSENGIMYAAEHGQTRNDEVNIIIKGGNYGWPLEQGDNATGKYVNPLIYYDDFTLAPSGIAYLNGDLYVTGLRGNQLRRLALSSDGRSVTDQNALFTNLGRIRDVVSHDGYLFICTSNLDGRGVPKVDDDKIIRIKINI